MAIASMAGLAATIIFPAAMIYAGIMDLLTMKIRNFVVLIVAISYFVFAPLAGFTLYDIGLSLAVAAAVFIVTFGFFAAGWIGGGDAKFASATALWFGWEHAMPYFIYATLAGGLLSLAIISFRSMLLPAPLYSREWIVRLHQSKSGIPYGAAFALAALIVFPKTAWLAVIA